ncbi:MAG TPA: hypothetical protein VFC10_00300 [Terriglobia bacterium]|nr:hypothetical protein [Terriglobia bacterium]
MTLAQMLIEHRYTSSEKFAVRGRFEDFLCTSVPRVGFAPETS